VGFLVGFIVFLKWAFLKKPGLFFFTTTLYKRLEKCTCRLSSIVLGVNMWVQGNGSHVVLSLTQPNINAAFATKAATQASG